jgi:translation initiation factor 2 subunit 3
MATMLSGAAIMDGAVLVIAANETCPQPQTREHLMALEISGTKHIVIVQNKIDLVSEKDAMKNYQQIVDFIKGTCAEGAPIIPVSAHHDTNIDFLIKTMHDAIPTPKRDLQKPPLMYVARSFDINKPGLRPKDLKGGVVGGSLIQGVLKKGDEIEISPGRKIEIDGKPALEPIISRVYSLFTGGKAMNQANPGGLLAIGTMLDPARVKSDSFSGKIVGKSGQLPAVLESFDLKMHLLKRVVGTIDEKNVEPLKTNEPLMLTVGTATTVGIISELRGSDQVRVKLKLSVCAEDGQRIAVSRRIEGKWHLIGYGEIEYIKS